MSWGPRPQAGEASPSRVLRDGVPKCDPICGFKSLGRRNSLVTRCASISPVTKGWHPPLRGEASQESAGGEGNEGSLQYRLRMSRGGGIAMLGALVMPATQHASGRARSCAIDGRGQGFLHRMTPYATGPSKVPTRKASGSALGGRFQKRPREHDDCIRTCTICREPWRAGLWGASGSVHRARNPSPGICGSSTA